MRLACQSIGRLINCMPGPAVLSLESVNLDGVRVAEMIESGYSIHAHSTALSHSCRHRIGQTVKLNITVPMQVYPCHT
jgi:hypothetical protein